MMRRLVLSLAACAAVALPSACSNDKLLNGSQNPIFQQIDRVGRPGIVELFSPYANHDAFDRSAPSGDATTIGADIGTFMTQTAGRSSATATYVQGLLTPDVLVADTSSSATASYLGLETQGKLGTNGQYGGSGGGLFGGRGLTDDVVTANLGLAFGSTVEQLGGAPDDGNEQDGRSGRPILNTDNVGVGSRAFTSTFPYLPAPH